MMNVLEGPTPAQLQAIKKDLGENSERMQNNLQLLHKWISCQSHLPQDFDNNLLSVFLRGCKHDLERTKKKIDKYFITRACIPELFLYRDPNEDTIQNVTKMIKIAPLPKLTLDGNRVTIFKIASGDHTEFDMREILRYVFMTADIRVVEESAIAGDIFVYDLKYLKASHLLKYLTPLLKKSLIAAQEAYPQRLKQLHFIYAPPFLDKALTVTKALLNEKMRKRFILHKNVEDLLQYIPSDILPTEYGGTAEKFNHFVEEWSHCIIKHNKWFQLQDTIKAKDYFSVMSSYTTFMDTNGIAGSFRKLEID